MFKIVAEYIVYLLIKKKLLDIKLYDIYLYAVEIIILNGGLLLSCFLISICTGMKVHFLCFVCFFIPLRMYIGGYHCKTSERCFICSLVLYLLSFGLLYLMKMKIIANIIMVITAMLMIVVFRYAPLIHERRQLNKMQIRRNKKIEYGIILLDFVIFIILAKKNVSLVYNELIFLFLAEVIFILGLINNYREKERRKC